ncbi:MAG TPA: ABC transporter permease [Pseudolysinimonas sp.]|nr:ABC transporter permease [Pseudolysinimonas sp.]
MTTTATAPERPTLTTGERRLNRGALIKGPIGFGIVTIGIAVLSLIFARPGISPFVLATRSDFVALPPLALPAIVTGVVLTVALAAATIASIIYAMAGRTTPLWLVVVFAILALGAFLVWASAGADRGIVIPSLLVGAISLSTPLIFGALGGVLSERSGVVNIAIEGQLLGGAFVSAMVASSLSIPLATLFNERDADGALIRDAAGGFIASVIAIMAAGLAGVGVALLLALFGIRYIVDQVIVGVVLNVLVVGITGFLYSELLTENADVLNSPPILHRLPIPLLSQIPIIGPALFNGTFITYLMYLAVPTVWFALTKTRWGLRVRAVGEHPKAADTVGINVTRRRLTTVLIAGAIAGAGGAFFTLGSVGGFTKEVTAGAGFIALAAVIFGRWDPIRATLAALLFGFATYLQYALSSIGSPVPGELMRMLPYLATVLAVAGFVGRSRAPAADGKPYISS